MRLTTWTSAALVLAAPATAHFVDAPDLAIQAALARRQVVGTGTSAAPDPTTLPTSAPSPSPPTSTPDPSTSTTEPPPSSSSSSPTSLEPPPPSSSSSTAHPTSSPTSTSSPTKSSTYTSALVTSVPVRITTTVVTVDPSGITHTSEYVSETLSASTTGFATITAAPNVNAGDDNGGSSGLSSSTKKIIGGVVGGIGGAVLLGGLAVVAWRLWGRKKQKLDEDEVWQTGRAEGESTMSPGSSGATVTSHGTKSNPAANF